VSIGARNGTLIERNLRRLLKLPIPAVMKEDYHAYKMSAIGTQEQRALVS
jgi:hypothetical protein